VPNESLTTIMVILRRGSSARIGKLFLMRGGCRRMAHDSTWSLTMWEGGASGCVTRHARAGGCSVRLDVSLSRMDAADAPGYPGCADQGDLSHERCTMIAKMHHGKRDVQEEQRASCERLYLGEVLPRSYVVCTS